MTEQLSEVLQKLAYWIHLDQRFPGWVIERLSAYIRVQRENNSTGGSPLWEKRASSKHWAVFMLNSPSVGQYQPPSQRLHSLAVSSDVRLP